MLMSAEGGSQVGWLWLWGPLPSSGMHHRCLVGLWRGEWPVEPASPLYHICPSDSPRGPPEGVWCLCLGSWKNMLSIRMYFQTQKAIALYSHQVGRRHCWTWNWHHLQTKRHEFMGKLLQALLCLFLGSYILCKEEKCQHPKVFCLW